LSRCGRARERDRVVAESARLRGSSGCRDQERARRGGVLAGGFVAMATPGYSKPEEKKEEYKTYLENAKVVDGLTKVRGEGDAAGIRFAHYLDLKQREGKRGLRLRSC